MPETRSSGFSQIRCLLCVLFFFPLSTAEFFCLFVELLQWREPHAAAVLSRHSGFDKPAAERRVPAAAVSEQRRCHRRRSSWKAAARLGAGISAQCTQLPRLCVAEREGLCQLDLWPQAGGSVGDGGLS